MKKLIFLLIALTTISCVSTKNTIMNIDDKAVMPKVVGEVFVLTEISTDSKYGFNPDYPINLGFYGSESSNKINVSRFFNGFLSPNGKKIVYTYVDSCCPFPTKRDKMGAGTLEIYEITWEGNTEKLKIYIDLFEKGQVICPKGFSISR
jgi:hypothetical protein